ncbi:MAG: hypothetical protein L6U99_05445 [Clostridium sp.]|nr:MAG: hypothetical protein L6U99_05445 [Clostridium sp.]
MSYPYNSVRNCDINVSSYNYPFAIVKNKKMICGSAPLKKSSCNWQGACRLYFKAYAIY